MSPRGLLITGTVAFLVGGTPLRAQPAVDSLERALTEVQGPERLSSLIELVEALQENDMERAVAYGRQAHPLVTSDTNPDLVRRLWLGMGRAYNEMAEYDSVLAYASELEAWSAQTGDGRGRADALLLEGKIFLERRATDEALRALDEAVQAYEAVGHQAGVAEAYRTVGEVHRKNGAYEEALGAQARAQAISASIGDERGLASALASTGILHAMQSDLDEAEHTMTRALELRERLGDEFAVASSLSNLSGLNIMRGNYAEALALLERALPIQERVGDKQGLAISLHNTSICLRNLGDHAGAVRALERASAIFDEIGDGVNAAQSLSEIGHLYKDRGDYETDLDFQRRALALSESYDHRRGSAVALDRMGSAYYNLGDMERARDAAERALDIYEEMGLTRYIPGVLSTLALIYADLGTYGKAVGALERGITGSGGDQGLRSGLTRQLGDVYLRMGRVADALAAAEESLAIAESTGDLSDIMAAQELRSELFERQERFAEALAAHQAFKAAQDSLFSTESESALAELQQEYQTREQRQRIELLERDREAQRLWVGGLVGGLVLLTLLVGLAYNRSRLKQRANVILTHARDDLQATQAQLQAEMAKTEEQAAQLAELDEVKSRFFANISHELRTPLTLTLGPLEDLREGTFGRLSAEGAEQVDVALRNSRRLLRLVGQLLDVAKLESGRFDLQLDRADLGVYVRTLAQPFVAAAERRRIHFTVDVPARPVPVSFDPDHLDKIVANLLSNAIKFTPAGEQVHLTLHREEKEAVVTVRDTGPGIPEDQLDMLFERFSQVEKSGMQPGTGIGLALAKEITELHGGRLTVESEVGVGSTFTLRLPVAGASGDGELGIADLVAAATAPTDDAENGTSLEAANRSQNDLSDDVDEDRTTVLVVDDSADIRAYVRRHLEDADGAGYRVVEAEDGETALDALRARLPDLVVSDVMMPRRDGFGLLAALRSNPETDFVPVVLLTARAEAEDRLEGLGLGADDYLTKPFDARELVARVDNLIAQRQRLRERFRQPREDAADNSLPTLHPEPVEAISAEAKFLETVRVAAEAGLGDENFGVDALAEAVGLSRSSLHRRLTDLTGESPSALLRRMRLERGANLLRDGAGTVSEVAYASGFKSVSHFSSSFGKHFGQTPTAYTAEHTTPRL